MDLECRTGLRGRCKGLGGGALVLPCGVLTGDRIRSIAELLLVDGVELPESDATLGRR